MAIVNVKEVSQSELRKQIIRYARQKVKAYPSDIAADLGVPYFDVTEVIAKLVEEGILEEAREE